MALTITVSPAEFQRVADEAYSGRRIRVSLAYLTTQTLTESSSTASWDALKIVGNGYNDFLQTLGAGGYDSTDGRFEIGSGTGSNSYFEAVFTSSGAGYVYNRIYVVISDPDGAGGWTERSSLHSLLTENPNITLGAGTTIKYRIQLVIDN